MKQFNIIFFALFICFQSFAQLDVIAYKKACSPAYSASFYQNDFKQSNDQLKRVLKEFKQLYGEEFLLMARNFKQLNQLDSAACYLKKAWSTLFLEMGYSFQMAELNPTIIMEGFSEHQVKLVEEGYEEFAKLGSPKKDSINLVLTQLSQLDQSVREVFGKTAEENKKINTVIEHQDSITAAQIEQMVLKIGFPGEHLITGNSAYITAMLVHTTYVPGFVDRMKNVFYNELKKGNMPPTFYALWIDKYQTFRGLPQIYGMINNKDSASYSEKEKEMIRLKRSEIGIVEAYPIPAGILFE